MSDGPVPRCREAWQTAELSPGNLHHCDLDECHDGEHRCVCGDTNEATP